MNTKELIKIHCALRKEAFDAVSPKVAEFFREAESSFKEAKYASENVEFNSALRRHFVEK